jgi:hypothetical protein
MMVYFGGLLQLGRGAIFSSLLFIFAADRATADPPGISRLQEPADGHTALPKLEKDIRSFQNRGFSSSQDVGAEAILNSF